MLIKKITIHNFGKIHNRTFDLSEGINVLYGENESGKTTVHTFIKGMLYGIPRQRGRAAANDIYRTYEPWENPGEYGGTIWFEAGGMSYRLTRNFRRERPFGELLCERYRAHALEAMRDTPIVHAELGNDAGIYGAAFEALRAGSGA